MASARPSNSLRIVANPHDAERAAIPSHPPGVEGKGITSLNPYETLGLDKKTATPEKIRKAYRKKAAQAHPDNPRPVGDFFAIQQANRILSDPNAKQIYDETGIVMGEDKLAEEAIMLIVAIAVEILAKKPTCDLPAMLRATLDELRKQTLASAALVEQWIKQVEKRWKGAEDVKDVLLLNMHRRVTEFNRKTKVFARAKQLLETAKYEPAEQSADEGKKGPVASTSAELMIRNRRRATTKRNGIPKAAGTHADEQAPAEHQ